MTPRLLQARLEFLLQLGAVHLLHDEDDIGPRDQLVRQRRLGIVVCPRGCDLDIPAFGKHLLGGRAAQAILAADEEDVFQEQYLTKILPENRRPLFGIMLYRARSATTASSTIMPAGVARRRALPIDATSPSPCNIDRRALDRPRPENAS